jgi:hypothetical protein
MAILVSKTHMTPLPGSREARSVCLDAAGVGSVLFIGS